MNPFSIRPINMTKQKSQILIAQMFYKAYALKVYPLPGKMESNYKIGSNPGKN